MTTIASKKQQLNYDLINEAVKTSLQEDVGPGDLTALLLPAKQAIQAHIRVNETAVICGIPWVNAVFRQIDPSVELTWQVAEGQRVNAGQVLLSLRGQTRSILTAERTALNWLQTLSATATTVASYVAELAGTKAKLLDTRKTIPGLRYAQKYAVTVGGGENHRLGLFDAFLIKENHILSCGSITQAITTARNLYPNRFLEIEVENLTEFTEAVAAEPDRILLDNFEYEDLLEVVNLNQGRVPLEVSGNITKATIRKIALTGVDYISVGGITKNIQAIDLSLRLSAGPNIPAH